MPQTPKKHSPRQELLKIEKKIYAQNQLTIKDSSRVTDKNFKVYYRAYKKAIRHYTKSVTPEVVEADIARSRVVFVGDYHTLDQSQRSFVRILRSFFRHQHKEVIICIEAVQQRHQKHLNEFLSGTSDKDTFIKKIGFKAHWFFDLWENYSIIFDFLRYHKIPVFGIEMNSADKRSLKERDAFMAEQIVARAAEHPNKVVFVLVGDLHLAPPHLPREVNQRADKAKLNLPQVLLYQNSPEIYWQLSQKNIVDHTLIVKTGQGAYCRMHTPPIIVQQSYINWLYHEEGVFDWVDPKASFLLIVEQLAKILQLKLPADYAEVEVYTCGDLGFMRLTSFKKKFSKKELKFIQSQLLGSESYFMPQARIVYIANVSIHHAAEEASHYVKHLLTGPEIARSHRDAFYTNVLHEAIGFFGSKLVNARRKCARLKDMRAEVAYIEHAAICVQKHREYETAQMFIKHARSLRQGRLFHSNLIANFSPTLFLSLSHAIGYDLGDHLYYAFMENQVPLPTMQRLFNGVWAGEGEPPRFYEELFGLLKGVKRPGNI